MADRCPMCGGSESRIQSWPDIFIEFDCGATLYPDGHWGFSIDHYKREISDLTARLKDAEKRLEAWRAYRISVRSGWINREYTAIEKLKDLGEIE